MTRRLAAACALVATVASGVPAEAAAPAKPAQHRAAPAQAGAFHAFVEGLRPQAKARGVSRETFDAAFAGVVAPDAKILALTKKQAEFVKPVWHYIASGVSEARIARGGARARELADTLARAERAYGVERSTIVGIWGMETNFGAFFGDQYVVRSLATLAFARYRGDFFRNELLTALVILEEGHVAASRMRGSWAGAMGQTQFMPSSFVAYAVDFDGDGRKDIWGSEADALGSTANYLKGHGWIAGETWGYEVILPQHFAPTAEDQASYRSFASYAGRGVRRADGEAMPSGGQAQLLLPAGLAGPAFLVTPNFKVIKSYNNSTSYALAVALLGDRIYGAGPLAGRWPTADRPLNAAQSKEMQHLLKRMGHDVGEVDGKLGEKAREALRSWQARTGLVADGYPTLAMLERMRRGR